MKTLNRTKNLSRWTFLAVFIALVAVCLIPRSFAQVGPNGKRTDVKELTNLSRLFEKQLKSARGETYQRMLEDKSSPQAALNDDPDIQLMYIDPTGHPVYYTVNNLNAARTISTDDVWPNGSGGYSMTGEDIDFLGIWDGGGVFTAHQEFGSRVTQIDLPINTSSHATHVAGTLMAGGVQSAARGMAFEAQLDAYDWDNDEAEMASAATGDMWVSNHSYGGACGWRWNDDTNDWYWFGTTSISQVEDYMFGFYDDGARAWDKIAFAAPFYTIVKSAGNDRNDSGPGVGGGHWVWDSNQVKWVWSTTTRDPDGGTEGYDCLPTKANAKNIITVGAVEDIPGGYTNQTDVVMTTFSSWGPTDDGRIKPDLVANGRYLYSCDNVGTNAYQSKSGTSMAAPNVAGSIALLVDHYRKTHSDQTPLSSTMKAILIHTADEAGGWDGPDYEFGWGLMNTLSAADLISEDMNTPCIITEDSFNTGDSRKAWLTSNGKEPLKITLAWTDPPGTPPAASLNPTDRMLVNDLDIRITRAGGSTYYPYVLNQAQPWNPPATGDNIRDNVEQIFIEDPLPGSYRLDISHKSSLEPAPQCFSLVITGASDPYVRVPSDYKSIKDAMKSVLLNGMVLVWPGIYLENIDFNGREIVLKSKDGPGVTILDGKESGSVVTFKSGEGPAAVLDGFSITNGIGTFGTLARMGGGIYCSESSPILKNNIIFNNKAKDPTRSGYGGGIYCSNSSAIIKNNTIKDNRIEAYAGSGGGIYFNGGSATMTGNIISGNLTGKKGSGGGISCYGTGNYLANNIIIDNQAGFLMGDGGGLCIGGDSIIFNNTICANFAPNGDGGGIDRYGSSTVEVMNSIVWNNNAKAGDQIHGKPVVMYCDVEGGYSGFRNIDQEPLFLDPDNGDYHLTRNSPCINRGTNLNVPLEDFEGDARPFMGTADMGADEFTAIHPLEADTFAMSVSLKDALNLTLTGGAKNGGRMYIILGSMTGNSPGMALPGGMAVLPINWDAFTSFIFEHMNTPLLTNFLGTLDATGSGWALFDPQGALTGLVGFTMSFSYAMNNPWDFASNPVNVKIDP